MLVIWSTWLADCHMDSEADKMNENMLPRSQSVMINEEQHLINDDQARERFIVLLIQVHAPGELSKVE